MIQNQSLKRRDVYLNRLIAFQDTEQVKVITGIRRCGKSKLLDLMIEHLKNEGIPDAQILKMNFESHDFSGMTEGSFYEYVKEQVIPGKRKYLFFDELQRVVGWENAVNAFRVDMDCDIYITGSNAYLLSSEYSTYLSGRYVEIKMLPLSFSEFLYFHSFGIKDSKSALGGTRKKVFDTSGESYEIKEVFDAYLRFGGMPGLADVGLVQDRALALLDSMYTTVIVKDILQRDKRFGLRKITDQVLLEKLTTFLADNVGNMCSYTSIANTLVSSGMLKDESRKGNPGVHTIQDYIFALMQAYFFYEAKRFDIKGKELLKTQSKFYIADIGFRNYLLGFRDVDRGHVLENIVYFELLRRGYNVTIGKVDNLEVDFRATKPNDVLYIQVTESMSLESVRDRELKPLKKISDSYDKIVLSYEKDLSDSYDGIKLISLVEWLLGKY
ncbi:MAG: ATP-binding protein [Eubacteriales bacterium]|nr:ATP-binding protein [Eubacteriales bacterium]